MQPDLTIRSDVRAEDSDAVRQLAEATGFFRPDEVEVAVELIDAYLTSGSASGYEFLFIQWHDRLIGYVCFGPIGCTVGSFDVYWIIVDPEFHGQGIGRWLLQQTEQQLICRNARLVCIETSNKPQYLPTRRFYERCGYQVAAIVKDFYDDGDDKVVMVRDLRTLRSPSI